MTRSGMGSAEGWRVMGKTTSVPKLELVRDPQEEALTSEDPFVFEPTEPAQSLRVGTIGPGYRIGQYIVTGLLAEGGMGRVYAGVEPTLAKKVAVKTRHPGPAGDPTVARRFLQEAHAVNQIGHKNVVEIYAFGQLPSGEPYLVMELLRGQTLTSRLNQAPPSRFAEAFSIL